VNYRDYFLGKRVTLRSPLRPEAVAERIRANAKRWFWSPFYTGPAGGVTFGRVRLRWVASFFEYNEKPVLVGTVDEAAAGSVLNLVYRGPTFGRLFYIVWYLFLGVFSVILLVKGTDPPLHGADLLAPFLGLGVMAGVPIGLHMWGTARSDEELDALIEFLEEVADARREG